MTLKPLAPGQVYVVVRTPKLWDQHPIPVDLVSNSTILSIFRSENTSDYALVYYNFSKSLTLELLRNIHIFDWEARGKGESGLEPAYSP